MTTELLPIGTRVQSKINSVCNGTVVGHAAVGDAPMLVICLDRGSWSEDQKFFISHIIACPSNVHAVPDHVAKCGF